jgi:hypothetical protein
MNFLSDLAKRGRIMIDEQDLKYRHEIKYQCSITQIEIIKNRLKNLVDFDSHTKDGLYTVISL